MEKELKTIKQEPTDEPSSERSGTDSDHISDQDIMQQMEPKKKDDFRYSDINMPSQDEFDQVNSSDEQQQQQLAEIPELSDHPSHRSSQQSQLDLQEREASLYSLLELTGLDFPSSSLPLSSPSSSALEQRRKMHQWRVQTMASRLVEQLRPWVEETVEPGILAHVISQACDEWKVLPLGAHHG